MIPATREDRFVLPSGKTIAAKTWYIDADNTDGKKLYASDPVQGKWIFLHGWLDNAASFDLLAPHFFTMGLAHTVVVLDLRGHGKSDHNPPYLLTNYVADVYEVIQQLGWEECCICSHSLGAAIATILAGTFPEKIKRLITLDAVGPWCVSPSHAPEQLKRSILAKPSGQRKYHDDLESAAQRRVEGSFDPITIEAARILCRRGCIEAPDNSKAVAWSSDPNLMLPSPYYIDNSSVVEFCKKITCPTLFFLAKDGAFRKAYFPGTRIFGFRWWIVLGASKVIVSAAAYLRFPFAKKLLEPLRMAGAIGQRHKSIRHLTSITNITGGHHLHLTNTEKVANSIKLWLFSKL